MLGQVRQYGGRCGASSHVVAAVDLRIVDIRSLARQELVEFRGQFFVGGAPDRFFFFTQRVPFFQLFATAGVQLFDVFEDLERFFRVPEVGDRFGRVAAGCRQRLSVRRNLVREVFAFFADGAFAHQRMAYDQRRFFGFGDRAVQRLADFGGVVAVDADDVPAPRFVFGHDVFGRNFVHFRRKLDVVRVVEHDHVAQTQMAGDTAHALRHLFLNTAVGDEHVGFMRHPFAEAGYQKAFGDRCAQRHRMSLAQRTRRVFDTAGDVHLGVSRRRAAPLTESGQFVHFEITCQRQHRIQHRGHVARIEEKTVAERVTRVFGIVVQVFRIENVYEIGTAHCAAGMSRLRFLHHGGCEDTDVIRSSCRQVFHLVNSVSIFGFK